LNVHEGPHGISSRIGSNRVPLKAGMIVSNEPGYYRDGHFGIRIENVVIVKEAKPKHNFNSKVWLTFEHVTMTPIQTKLVDDTLLTKEEAQWLDSYNSETLHKVGPLLKNDDRAYHWLKRECQPLPKPSYGR